MQLRVCWGGTQEADSRAVQSVYRDIHDGLREELVRSLGRNRFRLWFRDTTVVDVGERGLTLAVPNDVHRTWLQFTFGDALQTACERVLGDGVVVHLRVSSEQERRRLLREKIPQSPEAWDTLLEERLPRPSLDTFVLHRDPEEVLEAEGELSVPRLSARFPVLLLRQLLDGGAVEGAPSICLHGGMGAGKTHLLRGLEADCARRRPGAVLYLTARRFTQRYVNALRAKEIEALRAFEVDLGSRRIVLLDNVDELGGRESTQQELVRLLDKCANTGTRFVFAARHHPREFEDFSPRLRSRLLGGIVLGMGVPDRGFLGEILKQRARAIGVCDGEDVGEVREAILDRTSSVRGAVELMDRWAAASVACGDPLEADWLEELAPAVAATAREEVIRRTKDLVAEHFGICRTLLDKPTKVRSAQFPRRVAMYLVYRACALPLAQLGTVFGLRSHSSVSRAVREMRTLRTEDASVEQLVDGLLARL